MVIIVNGKTAGNSNLACVERNFYKKKSLETWVLLVSWFFAQSNESAQSQIFTV